MTRSATVLGFGAGLALCCAATTAHAVDGADDTAAAHGGAQRDAQGSDARDAPAQRGAQTVQGAVQVQAGAQVGQPGYAPQPQPQYVQPQYVQPAYPPPPYGYPPQYGYAPRLRRRYVPYTGGPVPQGARLETQTNRGLIIGGTVMFSVTYSISLLVGMTCLSASSSSCGSTGLQWLMLPVVGPFITLAYQRTPEPTPILVLDGLVQGAGLAMLIVGATQGRQVLVIDEYASRPRPRNVSWTLLPGAPGANAGLSLAVTHF